MVKKQYFIILIALVFVLTSSANAGMMCCWDASEKVQEQETIIPCHDMSSDEIENSAVLDESPDFSCCTDMSLCEVSLLYGVEFITSLSHEIGQNLNIDTTDILVSNIAVPPTPPPRRFL